LKPAISQQQDELEAFITLLCREGVRSYLEIGLRLGFTFCEIGLRLPKGSTLVGVDLPGAVWGVRPYHVEEAKARLEDAATELREYGQRVEIILGNSHASPIIARVREFGPYDAALIDGDHSYGGVRADWDAYAPMAKIVAFHDIDVRRSKKRKQYGVPELWKGLKPRFRHREIIGAKRGMGIGVLWQEV
jgi:predicted O-methyltransferase YrrM